MEHGAHDRRKAWLRGLVAPRNRQPEGEGTHRYCVATARVTGGQKVAADLLRSVVVEDVDRRASAQPLSWDSDEIGTARVDDAATQQARLFVESLAPTMALLNKGLDAKIPLAVQQDLRRFMRDARRVLGRAPRSRNSIKRIEEAAQVHTDEISAAELLQLLTLVIGEVQAKYNIRARPFRGPETRPGTVTVRIDAMDTAGRAE